MKGFILLMTISTYFKNIINTLINCGVHSNDTSEVKLQKQLLTMLPIIIGVVAAIWGSFYAMIGHYLSASIPLSYSVISLFSLIYVSYAKDTKFLLVSQLTLVLILPFLLMWSLGGFASGSYMLIWAFYAPLAAMAYSQKHSLIWLLLFVFLTIISSFLDDYLIEHVHAMTSIEINIFNSLNIIIGFGGIFYMMHHYIVQHDININIHKKNEILLSEAKKFAEQSSQSKSEFLANMSHEIRTPINAVIGMLYLTSKTELNDTQKSYISKADNAAKSLLGIIDDILDYSKVEAGKLKMESIDFQLEETISHISDIVAHQAKDKGIEFVVKHDPEIPEILVGDSLRLRQILINITNNAIKFTQKGEVIFSQKLLSKDDENVTILFCVEDSGIGISKEEQKKLFQEFVQVDGSLTRKYGGTGLGLAISKKLAEMMNGKIWIESSEPNVGTTVCCTVTLKTSSHSLDSYTFSKSLPEIFSSMNVLIVDDNASAREALFEMLKPLKFNVEMASSAKEAISMLEDSDMAYDFDLVFMDWKMPVMNGIEGSKAIRTSKKISKQPKIIMLTAYSKEEIIYEAGKDGIDAYLIKPVSPSLLFDTIMQTLGLSVAKKIEQSEEISLESIIGAKILLAEDNELNQDFALGLLRNKGLQVDVANNGEIALKMVQENRYDFVLMDIQMPVMNGLTATHHIRELAVEKKDKYYETLPIIAMTAHAMSDDRDRSIDAGMNEHITKPIDPDTIFSTLLRFIKPRKDTAMKKVESKDNSAQDNIDFSMLKNLNTNEALHRLDGDEKAYKKILLRFRDKYSNLSNEIQKLAKEEIDAAEKKCHELKGIFANIGANKLYEVILLIDDTLKNSELPSQTLYKRLEEEMAVIFDSISLFETSLDDNKISTNETFDTIKAKELLHRLLESLDHDIAESETILDQLEPIMASSKEYNMFKDVSKKVTLFEIKKAKELLLLLLKQLGEM